MYKQVIIIPKKIKKIKSAMQLYIYLSLIIIILLNFLHSIAYNLFYLWHKGKTVTIRVPEDTFEQIKGVCADLGESYNFNQFVNQSLGAILEVIRHDGEKNSYTPLCDDGPFNEGI